MLQRRRRSAACRWPLLSTWCGCSFAHTRHQPFRSVLFLLHCIKYPFLAAAFCMWLNPALITATSPPPPPAPTHPSPHPTATTPPPNQQVTEFLGAGARQFGFMLRGLRQLAPKLEALGIPLFLLKGALSQLGVVCSS